MEITENNTEMDIFEDDNSEEIEVGLENNDIEQSEHVLPLGIALNDKELYDLSSKEKVKIIYVLGPVKSGKTTFEAMLYTRFLKKIDDEILFSGSETLVGFEDRINALRTKSGEAEVQMPRTPKDERRTYLHLKLYDKYLGKKVNIILSDTSGETFEESKANTKSLEQNLPYLDMAERIVLFLDGEDLIDNTLRQGAVANVKMMLRTIKASNLYTHQKIDIIISKNDCIYEKRENGNVMSFIDNIESKFSDLQKYYNIDFYRIEALNDFAIKDNNKSTLLIDLMKKWIRDKKNNSYEFTENPKSNKFVSEFNQYGERY